MGEKKCSLCCYFAKIPQPQMGQCHRYPPTVFIIMTPLGSEAIKSHFPVVRETDEFWCGEFESQITIH